MNRKNTGGPAFPVFGVNCVRVDMDGSAEYEPQQISDGMTLRDYFATVVDKDDYGDILFRHMTRDMEEALAGPAPVEFPANASREQRTAHAIAMLDWHIQVRAAIRFRMADAMLRERDK